MSEKFCKNWLCETEATHYYVTDDGAKYYLCWTCKDAFEIGQINSAKSISTVDQENEG